MLTPRQQLFVKEYLIDLNATAAYKRAGYLSKGNSAEAAASRLLSNVKVAQAIQDGIEKRSNDLGIDAKYVLTTIKDAIERCKKPANFEPTAILRGAELLGKHLKLFTDKVEHSGSVLNIEIVNKYHEN